jgi:hypothetical protein
LETHTYRQTGGLTSTEPTTTEFGWGVIEGIETDIRELGKEDFDKLFGKICRLTKFHNGGHVAWNDLEDMLHAVCADTGVRTKTKLRADIRAARKKVGGNWLAPDGESRPDDYEPSWVAAETEVREYADAVAVDAIVRNSVPCVLFDDAYRWLMGVGVSPREAEFRRLVRRFAPRAMTADEMKAVREVLPMTKVGNDFNVCTKLGYRLVFEMVGTDGEVKSIRLRRPVLKAKRKRELKTLAIKGSVTHLLLANPEARALLRNRGKRPEAWVDRELHVVLTEGETDWLIASTEPSDAIRAVFGLTGPGQWCTRFAAAIPEDAEVFIATDRDRAGNRYARDAAQTLTGHRRLWRWRPWSVDDKGVSKFDLADVFGLRGGTSHAFG